ncbi:zinc finger protein 395b [Hypomesus transpacificus]|uniref:zinc finger protein 395b n=1 Tax=Hypomesus transpacificus TaxID=137520 RepID=UPI001F07823F|nr:zinc finger protein 395b [Hypomesus transpacificus]
MAATGPGAADEASPSRPPSCPSTAQSGMPSRPPRSELQESLVYMQCCGQDSVKGMPSTGPADNHQGPVFFPQRRTEGGWANPPAPMQTTTPIMPRFRSPESVEMDEIMAAMVLTSLSCSPVVQSVPQSEPTPGPAGPPGDMECAGGELSDSGSSGYWSWDHGNVSPAPSPSVTEMDSSPDEGLHMEPEQWEELTGRKSKSSSRGAYRCLWPGCGKVLTSSVGMKRHVRVLHLGSGSEHSQREEDFYYTKFSSEVSVDTGPVPQTQTPHTPWASCGSPPSSDLQIPPGPRPRSNSGPLQPCSLSRSAPSGLWQIHTEHLYQACSPVQVTVASQTPASQCWTPPISVCGHTNAQTVRPRCRSVSVGEQWLQQNSTTSRLQTMTSSPSRAHCSFRKGRGEAKKCRKVYGVERKDQWCTACRWKKACQRFPD